MIIVSGGHQCHGSVVVATAIAGLIAFFRRVSDENKGKRVLQSMTNNVVIVIICFVQFCH